jgi:hypothetical protein
MKKTRLLFLIPLLWISSSNASEVALVYENEAAVREGRSTMGVVTSDGVLIPAQMALEHASSLLVGVLNDKLRKASIVRLDNKLNVALIQKGDAVKDAALEKLFQERVISFSAFVGTDSVSTSSMTPPSSLSLGDGFVFKINGEVVDSQPITLPLYYGKSNFKLEVIQPSTAAVWNVKVTLTSDPQLSFWKKDKTKNLNDVPRPTFVFEHQAMFRPLAEGRSVAVGVEVYYIKQDAYTFNLMVESKLGTFEKKVPVIFKRK